MEVRIDPAAVDVSSQGRVLRGGSWNYNNVRLTRVSYRNMSHASTATTVLVSFSANRTMGRFLLGRRRPVAQVC